MANRKRMHPASDLYETRPGRYNNLVHAGSELKKRMASHRASEPGTGRKIAAKVISAFSDLTRYKNERNLADSIRHAERDREDIARAIRREFDEVVKGPHPARGNPLKRR